MKGVLLLSVLLGAFSSKAGPLVVGFDRFHASQPTAEGGRLLYNELGCGNCHGGETGLPARRGPILVGVTLRAKADWLRAFLVNPSSIHAGSTMPRVLQNDDAVDVDAVLHYLGSLKPKAEGKASIARHVNAERGRDLFHTLGCVACHAPGKDFQPAEGMPKPADFTYHSVGLPVANDKHVLSSLAEFIRNPLKIRTDGRMPRTEMDEQDSLDLAGYLLNYEGSDGQIAPKIKPFAVDNALVERGRNLVASLRCAACHDLPTEVAAAGVPLRQSDGGCLAATPGASVPHYDLADPQRAALKVFLAQRDQTASATQLATLTLEALNCLACHDRDGRGGPDAGRKAYFTGDHNLADTGRYPPPLTGVGRKLQPAWLAKVLAGEGRMRPYLETKMPIYGTAVATTGVLLARADHKTETPLPAGEVEAGRKLLGTLGGVSCITCHRWGERASLGIQSLDLSTLTQRIQPAWLAEYLVNPAAYRAGTLMPSFWPEGKAANQEILHGDTMKQIASIYAFAANGKGEPEGYPSNTPGQFELIPTNQPIVLRTFMEGVGTHAILVGFPAGVHLAYDGLHAHPALAWKGKFFDAYSTWFSRFAPFEKPLGDAVVKWPAASTAGADIHFGGYRLDAKRNPVFLYTVGGTRVEERFEGLAGGLHRELTWDVAAMKSLEITHPADVAVGEDKGSVAGRRSFTYHWK